MKTLCTTEPDGKGCRIQLERRRVLGASAKRVWDWMIDAHTLDLFHLNVFHATARCEEAELRVGSRIRIEHHLGWRREARTARISTLEAFEIAWSEVKDEGADWFPHQQGFVLVPTGDEKCELRNTLRGSFRLPGARWWLLSWYGLVLPRILDAENRGIARAVEGDRAG